ncbi:MAG: hypothetical protein UT26_C0011G0006 [Microgenomates group bacterium GW2011_GWC1_39_12]|nr:MAG: hypothetical protein UT26_C0011G0006 [Microgenomates group bacterium GW2011_GWC1_39_12]
MTKPSEADDLGEGSDLEFPGQEVLEDGSVVGIDREQGWLTSQLNKLFPNSPLFWGRQTTTHMFPERSSDDTARDQLDHVSHTVNNCIRDGTIDPELLRFYWQDAEMFSLEIYRDPQIFNTDPHVAAEAWAGYLFPVARPRIADIPAVLYLDDQHDSWMKQIPLGLLRGESESEQLFLSLDLHDDVRSILIHFHEPRLVADAVQAIAYAADAAEFGERARIAQYLIADPGKKDMRKMYERLMKFSTYGDSSIEGDVSRDNPLFHTLHALATLSRSRIAPDNPLPVDPEFHYIFYIPDMSWFIRENPKTWESLVQPLLADPDPRITFILGMPYMARQQNEVFADWDLYGAMGEGEYQQGLGRLHQTLHRLPPHHVAFTGGDGKVATALILKP